MILDFNEKILKDNKHRKSLELKLYNLCLLESFLEYKDNWNGYGASAFERRLIDKVYKIVNKLETQPYIFPTARDSIQLEYEYKTKDKIYYLEFEIFIDKITFFINMNEPLIHCMEDKIDNETSENEQIKIMNDIINKYLKEIDIIKERVGNN